ncbi:transmembrane protein 248 isoform X3 [Nelusetta ayraudi]
MGSWHPLTNLKEYVSHNPPGATFFLCLLTLALSFISLSSYSSTYPAPNPDTTKDWNHLLSSLSHFQLCVNTNSSSSEFVSTGHSLDTNRPVSNESTNTSLTTLHVRVPLDVTANSDSGSLKGVGLQTTLRAEQLHLGENEILKLTVVLMSGRDNIQTCLSISAPTHLLPMNVLPPDCPLSEENITYIFVEANNQAPDASQTCYSLSSRNDPSLAIMLTQEEQSVAARHMLGFSMGLLGVCFVLCLAASLTNSLLRRNNWNELDQEHVILLN